MHHYLQLPLLCVMSKSTGDSLNHLKRRVEDEGQSDATAKRAHVSAPTMSKPGPLVTIEVSSRPAREVKKKPDLDLLIFKPFLMSSSAKALCKHLLASLPWYKVDDETGVY